MDENKINILKKLNLSSIRDMTKAEMEDLHMELMPQHHNCIADLQEKVNNIKKDIDETIERKYDHLHKGITERIDKFEKDNNIQEEKVKMDELIIKSNRLVGENLILRMFAIILLIGFFFVCVRMIIITGKLETYNDRLTTLEVEFQDLNNDVSLYHKK